MHVQRLILCLKDGDAIKEFNSLPNYTHEEELERMAKGLWDIAESQDYIAPEILDHPELLMRDDYYNVVEDKTICGHWRSTDHRHTDSDLRYDKYGDIRIYYPSDIAVGYFTTSSTGYLFEVDSYKCDGDILTITTESSVFTYRYDISEDGNILTLYDEVNVDVLDILERIE